MYLRTGLHRTTTSILFALLLSNGFAPAQVCSTDEDQAARTKPGQAMPSLSVTDTKGQPFSLASQKGKVVLVNFWATWCPPCRVEMPRLEKDIWEKYKGNPDFSMIAIAREQTANEIKDFQRKTGYTFPLASDPKRTTYALFAESGIPRSYVVGRDGKILAQTVGYCDADFDHLEAVLRNALDRKL